LQLCKIIDEGLLNFKKPPNVDLDIVEGAITNLIEVGLETQGTDRIDVNFIQLAIAIKQAKDWC
jgi:hypothetical protein